MEERTKHRLVGAGVLALAAAVVLPLVLRGSPPEVEPPAPAPSDAPSPEPSSSPSRIRIVSLGGGDGGVPPLPPRDRVEAASPPVPPAPAEPAEPPRGVSPSAGGGRPRPAAGWAVQIGSFADPRNADNLRGQIASQGFPAFTQQVKSKDGKPRVRVLVGTDEKRSAAAARLSRLQREASVEGFLVRYPG